MDPLRLIEIAQDGDFQRVRQLVQEHFPLSPEAKEEQRKQRRDHPWSSPIERYRNKQLSSSDTNRDDEDLEELSWKHRSKAYDLTRSDVTSKRVYHSDDEIDNLKYPSKGLPPRYTDKRPKSIETSSFAKTLDEPVITPATIPMDEDEFDSPYHASTPSSITLLDSSPSVVTPPKAVLDQLALDQKELEGTEVTLEMFEVDRQKDRDQDMLDGAVKQIMERRSGVKKLIEEHERLMAETKKTVAVATESSSKQRPKVLRRSKFSEKGHTSSVSNGEKAVFEVDDGQNSDDKMINTSVQEIKLLSESKCKTEIDDMIDDKIRRLEETRQKSIDLDDQDEEDETFMQRASILTTIVEESTPRKVSSPLTISAEVVENDAESVGTWKNFRKLNIESNIVTPEKLIDDSKVTYTRKQFKEKRITPLNKVTIAAALIEYNEILMEEKNASHGEMITNDTRLIRAIMKHRKENGFFTDMTPTNESIRNGAATIIQAACRQFLAIRYAKRKVESARNFAAILIQARWRTYDNMMTYKWHRGSAILLQAKWKSLLCQKEYSSLRSSTILLQSMARMLHCKADFIRQKSSAHIVQRNWRSFSCQKEYNSMRFSVILVQSLLRMHQCRTKYLQRRDSATIAQALWRSYTSYKHFKVMRSSSIVVQSLARMHSCRNNFLKQKSSSISIQAASRLFLCRLQYADCKRAATTLQSMSRMLLCRMKFIRQKRTTIVLQALVRMSIQSSKFHLYKESSVKLQSLVRMKIYHAKYLESMRAVVKLQAAQRMNICRSNYIQYMSAATTLESFSRMCLSRGKYLKQRSASTTLQAALRRCLCRFKYVQSIQSAIVLQKESRAFLCRSMYLKKQKAAIALQGIVRMYLSRANYLVHKFAAFVVQDAFRGYMQRKDHATFEAIRKVQMRWRSSICLDDHTALMEIKKIPTSHRTSICKRNFMQHLSASIIQKIWRNYYHRKTFEAARCIQASFRKFVCWKNFALTKQSANRLQQQWRSYNSRKTYLAMLTSAKLIQSRYRTHICKKNDCLLIESTIRVQSKWRCYSMRKEHLRTIMSAIKLQNIFRAYACRKRIAELVSTRAATKLESIVRMFLCRKYFAQYRASTTIQAAARMHLCRSGLLASHNAATTIQTAFRSYICCKLYNLYLGSLKNNDVDANEDDPLVGRSSILTTVGENSEIDFDEDGESFLARSSILTTIVEERSSLPFGSPPLESPSVYSHGNEPEDEKLPTTIKKKRPHIILEERQYEKNIEGIIPVEGQPKNVQHVQIKKSEQVEDRRSSEERLLALAAKVAKRRASLNRKNRPQPKTKDPWQERMELQKKSKPVLLSKRMAELEKHAKQKRVTSSRFNTKEEQNSQTRDDVEKKPLVRYTKEMQEFGNEDSVVKKLFESDGHDDVIENAIDTTGGISEKDVIIDRETDVIDGVHSEISDQDAIDLAINEASNFAVCDGFPDDTEIYSQYLETFLDENAVISNEELFSPSENFGDSEQDEVARSWKRLSIVDELAEDICAFDTDSDSDDDRTQNAGIDLTDDVEIDPFAEARSQNVGPSGRSKMMEWSVVDDLVDNEDVQYDEDLDSEDDDDYEENGNVQLNEMSLSKIQKEHPLWSITTENVSEALTASLYTVAGVAASLIGMGE